MALVSRFLKMTLVISLTLLWAAHSAHAKWAELQSRDRSRLILSLIQKHPQIHFCLNVKNDRFSDESLQIQVESSIALWLKPLKRVGISSVEVMRVPCNDITPVGLDGVDLAVVVEDDPNPKLTSYQQEVDAGDEEVPVIHLLTSFRVDEHVTVDDFIRYLPKGMTLQQTLFEITFQNPTNIFDYSQKFGFDYRVIYQSSYPTLIHEMGHAFGLCDTYKQVFPKFCDPQYMSSLKQMSQPPSVMRDSDAFYLKKDDLIGLEALFTRMSRMFEIN